MLAEGNPVARTARKEGTGSPCPMLPSPLHAQPPSGWFVSDFLRGDDGTDLNGALKLQLCGSADPDFRLVYRLYRQRADAENCVNA